MLEKEKQSIGYGIHINGEPGELFDGTKDSFVQFVSDAKGITDKDFGIVNDCDHFYEKFGKNVNVNARGWIFSNVLFPLGSKSANANVTACRNGTLKK